MFDLDFIGSGRKFHRDPPENVRLDLNRSIRGLEIVILVCYLEELIRERRVNEGGAWPAIIFCMDRQTDRQTGRQTGRQTESDQKTCPKPSDSGMTFHRMTIDLDHQDH